MIYLDLHRTDTGASGAAPPKWLVRCYLFEPNGSAFARKHSGYKRLQDAWTWVHHRTSLRTERTVRIVGEDIDTGGPEKSTNTTNTKRTKTSRTRDNSVGIQTLLGDYIRTTRTIRTSLYTTVKQTGVQRRGYGVCGTITFWFFVTWLWAASDRTLEQHYTRFYHYAREHREVAQKHLLRFIIGVNAIMMKQYGAYTEKRVQADMRALRRYMYAAGVWWR